MPDLVVVDTCVLQKANAPIGAGIKEASKFAKRLELLRRIRRGQLHVLISSKLLAEYRRQVRQPRNVFVQVFMEMVASPDGATSITNWCRWSGNNRGCASKCRFPREDYHVLRTAIHEKESAILSEEHRMLITDACIHNKLRVHVIDPTA